MMIELFESSKAKAMFDFVKKHSWHRNSLRLGLISPWFSSFELDKSM